jgi:hypothetical protein
MTSPLAKVLSFTLLFSSSCVGISLSASNTGPVVELTYGSFQGNSTGDLVDFLGIPFAAPPYASTQILLVVILLIDILLSLKALEISDLHRRNHLSNSLESAKQLVLEQLAFSKHYPLFQASAQ